MTDTSSLAVLLRWYREEFDKAIPSRIHSRSIDDGGAPEWHGAFRAWLTAHPATEDAEGQLISPLRYWVWRMPTRRQRYLMRLAACDFDWRHAAGLSGILDEDAAHDYTRATLHRLHRLMYSPNGLPNEPRRHERGDCAEPGCPNKTTRLRCQEHRLTPVVESV